MQRQAEYHHHLNNANWALIFPYSERKKNKHIQILGRIQNKHKAFREVQENN